MKQYLIAGLALASSLTSGEVMSQDDEPIKNTLTMTAISPDESFYTEACKAAGAEKAVWDEDDFNCYKADGTKTPYKSMEECAGGFNDNGVCLTVDLAKEKC